MAQEIGEGVREWIRRDIGFWQRRYASLRRERERIRGMFEDDVLTRNQWEEADRNYENDIRAVRSVIDCLQRVLGER